MTDPRVLAAIISVAGMILSAVLAFFVSRRQVAVSIGTAQLQSQTVFLGKLYETRLKSYPELYAILGSLGGKIISHGASLEDVEKTWLDIRNWDSQNALFLSPFTVQQMLSLRRIVTALLKLPAERLSKTKQKKELLPALIRLQMCLKTELGILHADSFHNPSQLDSLKQAVARASDGEGE